MALIFNVTHTVTFGTHAGEDYQWELDLLRSYDDSEATPSWVNDATVQVTATSSPIEIEWMSDNDTYKPIIGSKAQIGIHKVAGDVLPRFTSSGQFEYQARLRYRRNGESTLNDYWCGFIQSSDGSESVSSISPVMSFTAIDNLGGLEDTSVDISVDSITPVNLFDIALEAIRQTGLDLPVLVESGIRNASGDALTDVTAHPYSLFTSEEENVSYRNKMTNKQMIEGLLSAFNCKIFQSYGRWFIVNASTHGGSGANETCTFNKYTVNTQFEYEADGTEDVDLLYNVGGSSPDMIVANSDLQLNTNRPYGSIECRPQNVKEKNYTTNGLLQSGTDGFLTESTSIDALNRVTYTGHPLTDKVLSTNRNRFYLNTLSTVWFKTAPMQVDVNAPIKFKFDWMIAQRSNQTVSLNYCVVLRTDNVVDVSSGYNNDPTSYYNTASQDVFTYNFDTEDWDAGFNILSDQKKAASKTAYQGRGVSDVAVEWMTQEHELNVGEYYDPGTGNHHVLDGTIEIYWFYPQTKRPSRDRWEGSDTNRVVVFATNVSAENKYSNDITKPVYERVQANYTKTESYKPYFADNLPNSVYNRFEQEGFWRRGETVADTTTLERIVTQQKLNDNRDEFRFYEGNLINISSDPIAPHHKLGMDWNNYTESETLIFKAGTFRPKDGTFDISLYAPNQSTDIAPGDGSINDDGTATPGFYEFDIDLVADDFTGRSSKVTYSLALVPQGLDDLGALLTDNPLSVEDLDNGVLTIMGEPGTKSTHVVKISVDEDYEAAASNMSFFDGTNQGTGIWQLLEEGEDTAEQLSNITFRDLGTELEIVFDVELPQRSEFEQLRIAGEVDTLVASNRNFDITFALDSSVTNATINSTTRNLRGIPDTTAFVNCIITPDDGKTLDASSFLAVVPTGVSLIGFEQLGTSVFAEFEVTFQEDDSTVTIDVDGDAAVDLPADIETSTVTLTLSESISNVSLSRTSLTMTGIVGTTAIYDITAYAADGFTLNSGNFSVTESEAWLNMQNAVGGGETVLIPLEITFPSADASGTATVNGSAQAVGSETIGITVNFTNNVSGSSLTDSSETFILNHGQKISYTNTLTPSRGTFIDATDLTITETSDASNLIAFTAHDAGGGSVNINSSITAPSSGSTASADLTLSGTTQEEPYVGTVNLTETLPYGRIINNTLSQRFGASDSNLVFSVTVLPTEGLTAYPSGTTFTISGATGSNYTYSGGNVSFDLTVPLPTFSSSFPIGNVSIGVSITGVAPTATVATAAEVSPRIINVPANGGTFTLAIAANGTYTFPGPLGGGENIADQFFTIGNQTNQGNRGGVATITVPGNTTGSARSFTRTLTDGNSTVLSGITVNQSAENSVESGDIVSISVNIGGSAGSTTGVLYIT